jgi:hypothetical protein
VRFYFEVTQEKAGGPHTAVMFLITERGLDGSEISLGSATHADPAEAVMLVENQGRRKLEAVLGLWGTPAPEAAR